jgi:3,4-dihydroxy 2-butanone 4-phosphate synthase/GTP cyclohydrolase II
LSVTLFKESVVKFDSIDAALADIKAGRSIIVVDDENRENEGDLICAAQFATPDMIKQRYRQLRSV